jgi:glucokinase
LLSLIPSTFAQLATGHEELIDEMVRAVEDIRVRHPGIAALGVGMPGFVNFEKGIVNNLTNVPGWADVPLKKILEKRVGLPVVVDNDANCMAIAEWRCGAGRGFDHLVCISLGTGVGGGIIANGQIIRGACYGAGEVGQTSIDYQGRTGHYGNRGALEAYVGNREITATAHAFYLAAGIQKTLAECSPAALATAAHHGDAIALAQWEEIGKKFATAVMNLCWLLNPEAIVIGGGVARAADLLFTPFKEHLFAQLSGPFKDQLRVMPAAFGNEAGAIGAAALAREALDSSA